MTPGEIARRLEDIARETRDLASNMLMREVYNAHQLLVDSRIKSLEDARRSDLHEQAATRRLVLGGVIAFASSVIVQIIVIFVTIATRGG